MDAALGSLGDNGEMQKKTLRKNSEKSHISNHLCLRGSLVTQ